MATSTTTLQGKVVTPDGVAATGGTITYELSSPARITDGTNVNAIGGVISDTIAATGDVSTALIPNDDLTPAGTYYIVTISVTSPVRCTWVERWQVDNTPDPVDIGSITRVANPTPNATVLYEAGGRVHHVLEPGDDVQDVFDSCATAATSETNPRVILVEPGIYDGLYYWSANHSSLVGIGDHCVFQMLDANYPYSQPGTIATANAGAPITIRGKDTGDTGEIQNVVFRNLTFHNTTKTKGVPGPDAQNHAFACGIQDATGGEASRWDSISLLNCRLYASHQGIGLWGNPDMKGTFTVQGCQIFAGRCGMEIKARGLIQSLGNYYSIDAAQTSIQNPYSDIVDGTAAAGNRMFGVAYNVASTENVDSAVGNIDPEWDRLSMVGDIVDVKLPSDGLWDDAMIIFGVGLFNTGGSVTNSPGLHIAGSIIRVTIDQNDESADSGGVGVPAALYIGEEGGTQQLFAGRQVCTGTELSIRQTNTGSAAFPTIASVVHDGDGPLYLAGCSCYAANSSTAVPTKAYSVYADGASGGASVEVAGSYTDFSADGQIAVNSATITNLTAH